MNPAWNQQQQQPQVRRISDDSIDLYADIERSLHIRMLQDVQMINPSLERKYSSSQQQQQQDNSSLSRKQSPSGSSSASSFSYPSLSSSSTCSNTMIVMGATSVELPPNVKIENSNSLTIDGNETAVKLKSNSSRTIPICDEQHCKGDGDSSKFMQPSHKEEKRCLKEDDYDDTHPMYASLLASTLKNPSEHRQQQQRQRQRMIKPTDLKFGKYYNDNSNSRSSVTRSSNHRISSVERTTSNVNRTVSQVLPQQQEQKRSSLSLLKEDLIQMNPNTASIRKSRIQRSNIPDSQFAITHPSDDDDDNDDDDEKKKKDDGDDLKHDTIDYPMDTTTTNAIYMTTTDHLPKIRPKQYRRSHSTSFETSPTRDCISQDITKDYSSRSAPTTTTTTSSHSIRHIVKMSSSSKVMTMMKHPKSQRNIHQNNMDNYNNNNNLSSSKKNKQYLPNQEEEEEGIFPRRKEYPKEQQIIKKDTSSTSSNRMRMTTKKPPSLVKTTTTTTRNWRLQLAEHFGRQQQQQQQNQHVSSRHSPNALSPPPSSTGKIPTVILCPTNFDRDIPDDITVIL